MTITNVSTGENCRGGGVPNGPHTKIYNKWYMTTKCEHKIDMDQLNKYVQNYSIHFCITIITVLCIVNL